MWGKSTPLVGVPVSGRRGSLDTDRGGWLCCEPAGWSLRSCGEGEPGATTIRGLVSEVVLEPGDDPVPRRSAVNLDLVESVSLAVLVDRIGRLSDNRMRQVCAALAVAVECCN